MNISEITVDQLKILAVKCPHWVADTYSKWMSEHHYEWMMLNRPEYMAEKQPKWMAENRPEFMVKYNPEWMMINRPSLYAKYISKANEVPKKIENMLKEE
jgi:hypothetical protein